MKILKYLFATAFIGLLAGCEKDKTILHFDSDDRFICINPQIVAPFQSRTNIFGSDDEQMQFNENDKITLKCNAGSVTYILKDGNWKPTDNYYLRWGNAPVTYSAYYPGDAADADENNFSTPNMQRTLENIAAADYMTCTVADASNAGGNTLNLAMERKMAKVIFTVNGIDKDSKVQGVKIYSGAGYSEGQLSSDMIAVSPYIETPENSVPGQSGTKYTAVVAPSKGNASALFIKLSYKGKEIQVNGIPELNAGMIYEYNMSVNDLMVSIGDPVISVWTDGTIYQGGDCTKVELPAFFVKATATGDGSGSDWDNAMDFASFITLIKQDTDAAKSNANAANMDDRKIYIAGGSYKFDAQIKVEYSGYRKQVKVGIYGGYNPSSTGKDLSKRDAVTAFDGNNSTRLLIFGNQTDYTFDGITFQNGKGANNEYAGAVFASAGGSGDCTLLFNSCVFKDNVNGQGAAVTGGKCLMKFSDCLFTGNKSASRGIVKLTSANCRVFASNCIFNGNLQGGDFGYCFHVSSGNLCANNLTLSNNTGAQGAINGAGGMLIANSTLMSDNAGAAIRCESPAAKTSCLINNIIINQVGAGISMSNSTGRLTSYGHNFIGGIIWEATAGTQYTASSNDDHDNTYTVIMNKLNLTYNSSTYAFEWNTPVSGFTNAKKSEVVEAMRNFKPTDTVTTNGAVVYDCTNLGSDFVDWLESIGGLDYDGFGNVRNPEALSPGSYKAY